MKHEMTVLLMAFGFSIATAALAPGKMQDDPKTDTQSAGKMEDGKKMDHGHMSGHDHMRKGKMGKKKKMSEDKTKDSSNDKPTQPKQ